MKKIKVFHGDKRLKDIYPHATRLQVLKYKTAQAVRKIWFLTLWTAGIVAIVWILTDIEVTKQMELKNQVPHFESTTEQKAELPPVMKRIAQCESGGTHVKKNGQVVMNINTNGTYDVGLFQLNEKVWGAKAGELHLDIANEEDNITMAMWIYANYGSEDWKYSANCWRY